MKPTKAAYAFSKSVESDDLEVKERRLRRLYHIDEFLIKILWS